MAKAQQYGWRIGSIRKIVLMLLLFIAVAFISVANATATITYETDYLRSDQQTVNGVTGYILNTTQSNSPVVITQEYSSTAYVSINFGWRVWITHNGNTTNEITSGTPTAVVTRNTNGNGIQNATRTMPLEQLDTGYDAVKAILYLRFGSGTWTAKATFTTSLLIEKYLLNQTWTFSLWTNRTTYLDVEHYTVAECRFGSSTYKSLIDDVEYADANPYEVGMYHLGAGNVFIWFFYPFSHIIGLNTVLLCLVFMCDATIYIRTNRNTTYVILGNLLLCGSSGLITALLNEVTSVIFWVFMLFALSGVFYKLVR